MEQETYDKLQSKINGIEAELEKTKLALESSRRDDFREEVIAYLEKASQFEISYNLLENIGDIKDVMLKLLSSDDPSEYSIAKQYFLSFKEKLEVVEDKAKELQTVLVDLNSLLRIIKSEISPFFPL